MSSARAHTGRRENLDLKGLGGRLRKLRGFDSTQEEMANELRISQSQLSKYERGVSAPPADVLFFMKNRFDVSIDWLLTGEGSSRTSNEK